MERLLAPPLLLLLLLVAAPPARATTLLRADVVQLARDADVVVHGSVVRAESRWSGDGRHILTDVLVEVHESLKGAPGKTVTIVQTGGRVGTVAQRVDGLARFTPGEEVVLFLRRRGHEAFAVAGASQGKFRVERPPGPAAPLAHPEPLGAARLVDRGTGEPVLGRQQPFPLEHLKGQVQAALGTRRSGAGR